MYHKKYTSFFDILFCQNILTFFSKNIIIYKNERLFEKGVLTLIGKRIKEIRKKMNITQKELAARLNVGQGAVSNWENGKRVPDIGILNAFSKLSGVSLDKIVGTPRNEAYFSYAKTYLDADSDECQYFAVKIKGCSMDKLRICDGDTLVVKSQDYAANNDIALVSVNDGSPQVREYFIDGTTISLTPHSSDRKYKCKFYNTRKDKIKIWGKVVSNNIKF